jgi:hypothetical protein
MSYIKKGYIRSNSARMENGQRLKLTISSLVTSEEDLSLLEVVSQD